jgi:hypothetical protein
LALGFRRGGSDDGVMRFAGRPESNVADKFTDTGNFPADHADELAFELLLPMDPTRCSPSASTRGWTRRDRRSEILRLLLTGSWMVTGRAAHTIALRASPAAIAPMRSIGAWEIVARYSHIDLTDGTLDGGELDKWSMASTGGPRAVEGQARPGATRTSPSPVLNRQYQNASRPTTVALLATRRRRVE